MAFKLLETKYTRGTSYGAGTVRYLEIIRSFNPQNNCETWVRYPVFTCKEMESGSNGVYPSVLCKWGRPQVPERREGPVRVCW